MRDTAPRWRPGAGDRRRACSNRTRPCATRATACS